MDNYEFLKAKYEILLAVVMHYAHVQNWKSNQGVTYWTPPRVYTYQNGEKKPSGYDAAIKALNTISEMEKKQKEAKDFCEQERKRYNKR